MCIDTHGMSEETFIYNILVKWDYRLMRPIVRKMHGTEKWQKGSIPEAESV